MSVEPLDDRPMRQARAGFVIFLTGVSVIAIWQLVAGAGLGWLLVLLANSALATAGIARATGKQVLYGAALLLGLGAALLGLADGLGYLHLTGGFFNRWMETAFGAGAAAFAVSRLYRQWRDLERVD